MQGNIVYSAYSKTLSLKSLGLFLNQGGGAFKLVVMLGGPTIYFDYLWGKHDYM